VLDCLLVKNIEGAQIGNTLTFLADDAMVELEEVVEADRAWASTAIQGAWRMHAQRRRYRLMRQ